MRILGIDPGLTGGLAVLDDGELVEVVDMPSINGNINRWALCKLIREWLPIDQAIVEMVGARPGQGVVSMFKFGRAYESPLTALSAYDVPTAEVTPSKWCAYHRVEGKNKDQHRQRAMELFPTFSDFFTLKKNDGRADAVLVAAYGWSLREN